MKFLSKKADRRGFKPCKKCKKNFAAFTSIYAGQRSLLHKYVVKKKSLIPSYSKSGILHSCYILWSREGRVFYTCTKYSTKLAHSWSCKLVNRSVEEQKFATKKFGLNSRPDRPERCGKASRDGGCRTLVPSGTGRQDSPGPGDGLEMDHFDPTRLKWGPQGCFDVFGQKKEAEVPISSPCQGGKTWETGPPVPHDLMTYGTPTPAPEPISKEKDRGENMM